MHGLLSYLADEASKKRSWPPRLRIALAFGKISETP